MSMPTAMILLAAQIGLNAASAWMQLQCLRSHAKAGILEKLTVWGVIYLANIAGLGLLLSAIHGLSPSGFLGSHIALFFIMISLRRHALREDVAVLQALGRGCRSLIGSDPWLAAMVTVVAVLGLLATVAQPVVYDALAYRMPRIGAWLQAGQISFMDADDARLNFMPYVPDLTITWLIGWFPSGYLPAALGQWFGGVLMLVATAGLALEAGLSQRTARTAVLMLLTMANVVGQFTAAHTDLYTAGVCAAAFYLGLCSLRRGSAPWLGAATLGLAMGCKGTMFYFAPIIAGWIVQLALTHRVPWRPWLGALLAGALAMAVFAIPTYWRNAQNYDSPLGPTQMVQQHHQGAETPAEWLRKGGWNLRSTLAQWCEPNSQPPGIQAASRVLGEWIAEGLPPQDGFTFENLSRTETLSRTFMRANPDADLTSPGLIVLALFLLGWVAAWFRPEAGIIRAWGAGIVAFFVFFHLMQQWHPYGFRYFVLAAPWLALIAASALDGLGRTRLISEWVIALVAGCILWSANTRTHQSGWRAVAHAENFAGFFAFAGWREWLDTFAANETVTVALPMNYPLAAFYRRDGNPAVRLEKIGQVAGQTAEQWVSARPGWNLLQPSLFFGREGRVLARTWLFAGDLGSPYSIVAIRRLDPSESPAAVVYQQRWVPTVGGHGRFELLVRSWSPLLRLRLENPGPVPAHIRVLTPRAEWTGMVIAGGDRLIEVKTLDESVAEIVVDCDQPEVQLHVIP